MTIDTFPTTAFARENKKKMAKSVEKIPSRRTIGQIISDWNNDGPRHILFPPTMGKVLDKILVLKLTHYLDGSGRMSLDLRRGRKTIENIYSDDSVKGTKKHNTLSLLLK